jgi:hypothetical protein
MKTATLLSRVPVLLAIGLIALLVSCETTGYGHLERNPEALGKRTGRADAFAGLSQDYERHLRELHPDADEDDFEDAYDDAYDQAEEEIEEREERREEAREHSRGRAYEQGYSAGEEDRVRGLSRNAYRHGSVGSVSGSWVDGYEDGWNGRR